MLKQQPLNMNSKRSISLVVNALLDLLQNKSYKKISITEITKHAGVVRATFYAHFETKEDVISHHIFDIFANRFDQLNDATGDDRLDLISIYFYIWSENKKLLHLLKDNNLLTLLTQLDRHLDYICFQSNYFTNQCIISPKAQKYSTTFYTYAMSGILYKWIESGMEESAEELTSIFYELIAEN